MTTQEAKEWYGRMDEDTRVRLLMEHHDLKQGLCANLLGVPTGTADWIQRSIFAANRLRETERHFRKLVNTTSELIEAAKWGASFSVCENCQGRKTTGPNESCVVCHGTGSRPI